MDQVFVYWDNSNIFHEAQRLAEEREGTPGARYLVRIHYEAITFREPSRPGHEFAPSRDQVPLDLTRRHMA